MKTAITLILFLAAVFVVVLVARPLWDDIGALSAERAAVADVLGSLEELQGLREEIITAYNAIPASHLERLGNFLPQMPESGQILVMLERLSRDRGIRLRRVEFSPRDQLAGAQFPDRIVRPEEAKFSTISYSFTISASYEAFRSFLSALEKSLRVVDVTDVVFTGGPTNLFEFTLKAKSYYQK